ncbi:hypothetical protein Pelo_16168 [Pelomyxa schiedti]|nr:hypothetical protein Pelo_16168 [Pelomyxa schiedti]
MASTSTTHPDVCKIRVMGWEEAQSCSESLLRVLFQCFPEAQENAEEMQNLEDWCGLFDPQSILWVVATSASPPREPVTVDSHDAAPHAEAIVGLCQVLKTMGGSCSIYNLAVVPEKRKSGLSSRIMRRAAYEANLRWGSTSICGTVTETRSDLLSLYGHLGCSLEKGFSAHSEGDTLGARVKVARPIGPPDWLPPYDIGL